MSPSRLIFHIGMPETNATAIQDALAESRDRLSDLGISYPRSGSTGTAHHPLAWAASQARTGRTGVPSLATLLGDLRSEVQDRSTTVISSEALFMLRPAEFAELVDFARAVADEVQAIAYVLPPAAYVERRYRRKVLRTGYSESFADHIRASPPPDLARRLTGFEPVLGSEVTVRPYQGGLHRGGDVVADFATTAGLPSFLGPGAHTDDALDAAATLLKRRLNQLGSHSPRLRAALVRWSDESTVQSILSTEQWNSLAAATNADLEALVQRFDLPTEFGSEPPPTCVGDDLTDSRFFELLADFAKAFPGAARAAVTAAGRDLRESMLDFPLGPRDSTSRFVILAQPRSGSSWLVRALDAVDGIVSLGEVFGVGRVRLGSRAPSDPSTKEFVEDVLTRRRRRSTLEFLEDLLPADDKIAGFKLLDWQATHPANRDAIRWMRTERPRVIRLTRADDVAREASAIIHMRRLSHDEAAEIPPDEIAKRIAERHGLVGLVDGVLDGLRVHDVTYEDLGESESAFADIVEFLGAPRQGLPAGIDPLRKGSRLRPQTLADLRERTSRLIASG